ncbi:kinase [Ectothiorhodospiraceae bacterium BW-2]|nr:kinase [Ectothiorhodospiraceae bacterium BW-2]
MDSRVESYQQFLSQQQLPEAYVTAAEAWFTPAVEAIVAYQRAVDRTIIVGINGSQGSGKSTLTAYLALALQQRQLSSATLSLDDFYLSSRARQQLAKQIHPLLQTRGVPGTHDMSLAHTLLQQLSRLGEVRLPRFDKRCDNPFAVSEWPQQTTPVGVVLFEGWCWGTPPQSQAELVQPLNRLEAQEDSDGVWRHYVNHQIAVAYEPLYQQCDIWLMLQAPSFETVYGWRMEQEQKLAAKTGVSTPLLQPTAMERFIHHYQRLTEHALRQLPARCHFCYALNESRQISHCDTNRPL